MLIYRRKIVCKGGLCWPNNRGDELPYPRKLLEKLANFIVHLLKMQKYPYFLLPMNRNDKKFLASENVICYNHPSCPN